MSEDEPINRQTEKWSVLVAQAVEAGSVRFSRIRSAIPGLSQRTLTLTLRGLERDGCMTRRVEPTSPPRVEYALTTLGQTLLQPATADWLERHREQIMKAQQRFDEVGLAQPEYSGRPRRRQAPSDPT